MTVDWRDTYYGMINDIMASKPTAWEEGFCDSITERLDNDQPLTPKQIEKLEELQEKSWSKP